MGKKKSCGFFLFVLGYGGNILSYLYDKKECGVDCRPGDIRGVGVGGVLVGQPPKIS